MALKFFDSIDKVFVINLKKDIDRRESVQEQLDKMKVSYDIINAVSHKDKIVKEMYKNNKVEAISSVF